MSSKDEYPLPDPDKNPVFALVISFKTLKGVEFDDRTWDRVNWGRCAKAARSLLDICKTFQKAESCLSQLAAKFNENDLIWTFETILKHSHDWMQKNGETKAHGTNARARLFGEIAKRRAKERASGTGEPTSSGEIVARLRDMQIIPSTGKADHGSSDPVDE